MFLDDHGDQDEEDNENVVEEDDDLNRIERNRLQEGRNIRNRVVENYCF